MPKLISASQITMYMRCSLQYYYRYIRGIKIQPGGTLTLGSTIHNTLKKNYTQKIESHSDMPIPHLQEFFADDFEKRIDGTEWAKDETPGKFKDGGIEIVRVYHTVVSPSTQPLMVEQRWDLSVAELPRPLVTIIDLIDSDNRIRDHKVSSRTPNQSIILNSIQLSIYSLAYRLATGKTESAVGLDYIIRNKDNEVKINRMQGQRDIPQLDRTVKVIKKVSNAIEKEVFHPCNPEEWQCSEKWCGYYHLCHKEW